MEVGDIPANLGYLLVLPFPAAEADNPKNHQIEPSIITFSEDNYMVADIIMELKESEHLKNKTLTLTFRNRRPLAKGHSMRIIAKELKR